MIKKLRLKINCLVFAVYLWFSNRMKSSIFVTRSSGLRGLVPHFGHIVFKDKLLIVEDYIPRNRKNNFTEKGDSFVLFDGLYRTRIYSLTSVSTSDSLFSARKEAFEKMQIK